jgi:TolB-like protein/Flp pilus assembly protein TadD
MPYMVFISHSNKDHGTAEAICNHLESAGIKCWIAPRDIEAGSDWAKGIMRGIGDCRVLVLVFTGHANDSEHVGREVAKASSLGLAVIPFRTEAVNPRENLEYFLETVQWLDAVSPPLEKHLSSLVERVKRLLADGGQSVLTTTPIARDRKGERATSKPTKRWIVSIGLLGAVAVLVVVAWFFTWANRSTQPTASTVESQKLVPGTSPSAIPTRSIAVLPFENLSGDTGSGYFADGIQDDILTNLAKISTLKVISRTSVMQYRAVDKRNLSEIGRALGVANLLEGTVRREGNRVRISTRLIHAETADTLWAETYDRDLTDIFGIQGEIAQTVADRLRAKLSPAEKKIIEERPTADLVAYDLYLQAKGMNVFFGSGDQREELLKQVSLLSEATRRDPGFALAYCLLARAHDFLYQAFYDHTPERRAQAEAAVNEAMRLRPDLVETRLALADYLYRVERDYERARTQLAIVQQISPNNTEALAYLSTIDRRQGRWEDATESLEKATDLDPENSDAFSQLAAHCNFARNYRCAERAWERILKLKPDDQNMRLMRALCLWGEKADIDLLHSALAIPFSDASSDFVGARFYLAVCARDWPIAKQTVQDFQHDTFPVTPTFNYFVPRSFCEGLIAQFEADAPKANASFSEARSRLKQKADEHPDDPWSLSYLGLADAFLGHKADAIAEGRHAVEILPVSKDGLNGAFFPPNLAMIYAWSGEQDKAIDELVAMIGKPLAPEYGELKLSPTWDPLRGHPRFEKLLEEAHPK